MSKDAELCKDETFSKIFMDYSKTLHNYLYYKTGNKNLAQDLTQESFVKLWQNCASVVLANATGYVFKIANNLLLNSFQHEKVVLRHRSSLVNDRKVESPEFLLEQKEFQERLDKAINELPEKQRTVFLLSRIDKKTYKEIAELLGISKQAVEKRMYIALNSLRNISKHIK